MRIAITLLDGSTLEYQCAAGRVVLEEAVGSDPELQPSHRLQDIVAVHVEDHAPGPAPVPEPARLIEQEIDLTPRGYLHDGTGRSAPVGKRVSFRTMVVDHALEPPPAPKRKPKAKAAPKKEAA